MKALFSCILLVFLFGCAQAPLQSVVVVKSNYFHHHKTLPDYVRSLSETLVGSSHYVNASTPVGVASFVDLEDYKITNRFGLQLAESFMVEMQHYGFSVIEHRSSGFIRITEKGDFVYSRNVKELNKRLPIEYLVMGTYTQTADGVLVNARLVGARSQVVVASAQQLIPSYVYNAMVKKPTNLRVEAKNKA